MRRGSRGIAASVAGIGLTLTLAACGGSHPAATPRPSPSAPAIEHDVTLGVVGTKAQTSTFRNLADAFDYFTADATVHVKVWPTEEAMLDDVRNGDVPDVFIAGREDVTSLSDDGVIQPVDSYLAARNVDLGDAFSRTALESFSGEEHLWCMPFAATPQVVYYNTRLVDVAKMDAAGLPVPDPDSGNWDVKAFAAAAQFATQPARGTKGIYVPPTLSGLAPLVYSAGGNLFDGNEPPTSLAFSSDDTRAALQDLLPVISDRSLTLTPAQLKQATPLTWFERGKLGMLIADRSIVPALRTHPSLSWDVAPIPGGSTVGDYTGLCMSKTTTSSRTAADLLAYLVSDQAMGVIARAGYVVPVNTMVALSDDFLTPGEGPEHAKVFADAIKSMHVLPVDAETMTKLDEVVGQAIGQLFTPSATSQLPEITERIDALSQPLLAQLAPSPSPSASASASASSD